MAKNDVVRCLRELPKYQIDFSEDYVKDLGVRFLSYQQMELSVRMPTALLTLDEALEWPLSVHFHERRISAHLERCPYGHSLALRGQCKKVLVRYRLPNRVVWRLQDLIEQRNDLFRRYDHRLVGPSITELVDKIARVVDDELWRHQASCYWRALAFQHGWEEHANSVEDWLVMRDFLLETGIDGDLMLRFYPV